MITSNLNSKKLKEQLQTEIDAAYLYQMLSEHYTDPIVSQVFQKMSEFESHHAEKFLKKLHAILPTFEKPAPSFRARLQIRLARFFGYEFIVSNLTNLERQISQAIINKKTAQGEKITGLENIHLNIIQQISAQENMNVSGNVLSKFEGKHKSVGGNELRAAVLGANDGLLSNLSLVMGVAGAANEHTGVLMVGIAGLLAGAISMALGEWLSVQSSRELYQRQIDIEAEELEESPEEEMNELVLLYQAKAMGEADAKALAAHVMSNKDTALDALVKEELGINKEALGGSAWKAAFTSFALFSMGAIVPVLPFFFITGNTAILLSLGLSFIALFILGASITLYTGKKVIFSGVRQVLFGLAAASVTYSIGKLFGMYFTG
ncbi:MAG: VIT1/CCC1 transporter family protein [Legionellales bacterium]|jgi:VIT1/CCC1 family predicted Fe2+/Mn2+ transporter/rubrerythrin